MAESGSRSASSSLGIEGLVDRTDDVLELGRHRLNLDADSGPACSDRLGGANSSKETRHESSELRHESHLVACACPGSAHLDVYTLAKRMPAS